MTEKIIPDGYKLVAVKGLDELVYWLERCKDKGHLENCADLIEPFEAFEYRNISEEAVIPAHEAKAAPAVPFGYFRAEPFGWTDCAETDEGAIALYERPAAPAVPQGWKLVPVEPTREMLRSGHNSISCVGSCGEASPPEVSDFSDVWTAMLDATPAAPSQEPVSNWPLKATVWKRESTQEWVLEIEGVLGETSINCRHTQPLSVAFEDVPGLPALYREPATLTDEQKRDIASNWFSEDWAIKQAMGLMDDYESAIAALREKGALR